MNFGLGKIERKMSSLFCSFSFFINECGQTLSPLHTTTHNEFFLLLILFGTITFICGCKSLYMLFLSNIFFKITVFKFGETARVSFIKLVVLQFEWVRPLLFASKRSGEFQLEPWHRQCLLSADLLQHFPSWQRCDRRCAASSARTPLPNCEETSCFAARIDWLWPCARWERRCKLD